MQVIVGERQSGRTTNLIKQAAEGWLYIVTLDCQRRRFVADHARKLGLDIPFPITFQDFLHGRFHRPGIRGFLIDDADTMLQHLAKGVPVVAVTMEQTISQPEPGRHARSNPDE